MRMRIQVFLFFRRIFKDFMGLDPQLEGLIGFKYLYNQPLELRKSVCRFGGVLHPFGLSFFSSELQVQAAMQRRRICGSSRALERIYAYLLTAVRKKR